jgi:archaeal flagellar protein FlaI
MKPLPELPEKKSSGKTKKLPEMPKKELVDLPDKKQNSFKIDIPGAIPAFPDVEKQKMDFTYPLLPPYASAHIFWDPEAKELMYEVDEPRLDNEEVRTLSILEDGIKELINISYLGISEKDSIIEYLEKNIKVLLNELRIKLSQESYLKIMYYIYRDFVGLGKIEPLMHDYFIEDVECNGTGYPIYIVHRKYRNLKTNIIFKEVKQLSSFVEKLAERSGQYISYATPLLDGALPDGSRVNATFTEDISSRGPTFTIRKFTKNPWSPIHLMGFGTISPEVLAYLWMMIEYEKNIMLIGGTASGKTTLLNALTFFIPPPARIVSIEDTRELNLEHSNWLPSVAREGVGLANLVGQKYGEVSLFNLLKESFRQNPDYVIVGEIRGKEAYVLFQGMASGHPSFGTMHANSVDTMIKRLETEPINLSPSLVETMDVVLVMSSARVGGKQVRRLKEIVEVISIDDKKGNQLNKPFVWNPAQDSFDYRSESYILKNLVFQQGISEVELMSEWKNRTLLLNELYREKIIDFHVVQGIINEYYKDPKKVMSRFKIR